MTFIKKLRLKLFKNNDENRKRDLTFLSVLFGVFAFNFFLFLSVHGGDIKAGFANLTKAFAKEPEVANVESSAAGGTIDDFYVYSTVSCGDNSQVFYDENGAKVGSTCSVWTTTPSAELSFNGKNVNQNFWNSIGEWFKSLELFGATGDKQNGYYFWRGEKQFSFYEKALFFDDATNSKFMYSTAADTLNLYKVFGWTSQWTPSGIDAHFFSTSPWTVSNYITGQQVRWNRTESTIGNIANRIYQYFPDWQPYSEVFYLTAHDLEQYLSGPKNTDSSIYVKISNEEFNRFYRVSLYPTFEKTGTGVWSSLGEANLNNAIGKEDYSDYYKGTGQYRTIYQLQKSTIRYSTTTKDGEQLENLFSGFVVSQNDDGKYIISDSDFVGQTFNSENEAMVAWLNVKHPGSTTSYYKGGENGGYFIFKAESELRNFPHFEVYQDNGSTQSWKNDNSVLFGQKEDASTFRYYLDSNGISVALSESEAESSYVKLQKYYSEQVTENYYYYNTTTGYGNPSILKNTDTKTYVWEDWYNYTITYDVYVASTYENADFVNDASNAFYAADRPSPSEKDYVFYKVTNASLFELKFYNLVYTKGNTWAVANGTADRVYKNGSDYYVEKYTLGTNNGDKVMKNYARLFWDDVGGSGYLFRDFTRNINATGILQLNANTTYTYNNYAYSMQQSGYKLYKVILPFWTLKFKTTLSIPETTSNSQLATYLGRNDTTGTFGNAFVVSTTPGTASDKVSFKIDGKVYVSTNSTITKLDKNNNPITCYVFKVAGTNDYAYFKVDEVSLDTMDFEMALYNWVYTSQSTLFCYNAVDNDLDTVSLTTRPADLLLAQSSQESRMIAGLSGGALTYTTLYNKSCLVADANDKAANIANAIYSELEYSNDGFLAKTYTGGYFSEFIQIDSTYFNYDYTDASSSSIFALQFPHSWVGYNSTNNTVGWEDVNFSFTASSTTAHETVDSTSAVVFPESSYRGIKKFKKDGYYYTLVGFRKTIGETNDSAIIWRYVRSATNYVTRVYFYSTDYSSTDYTTDERDISYYVMNKSASSVNKTVDEGCFYVAVRFGRRTVVHKKGKINNVIDIDDLTIARLCKLRPELCEGGTIPTVTATYTSCIPSYKGVSSETTAGAPTAFYNSVYGAKPESTAKAAGWFADQDYSYQAQARTCRTLPKGDDLEDGNDKLVPVHKVTCTYEATGWRFYNGNNYVKYQQGKFSIGTGKFASYTGTAFHTSESPTNLLDLSNISTTSSETNLNTYASTFIRNVLVQQIATYGSSNGWTYAFGNANGTGIEASQSYLNNVQTQDGSLAYLNKYYGGSAISLSDDDEETLASGFKGQKTTNVNSATNHMNLLLSLYLTEKGSNAKIGYIKQTNSGESNTLANGTNKLYRFTRYSEQYALIYDKTLLPDDYNVSTANGGSGLVLNADGNYFSEYYTYGPDTITPVAPSYDDLVLSTDYFSISNITDLTGYRILTLTDVKLKDNCSEMNNAQSSLNAFNSLYLVNQSSYATIEDPNAKTSKSDLLNLFSNSTNLSAKNGMSAVLAPSTKTNKTGYYLQTFQLKKVGLEIGSAPVNYTNTVLIGDSYSMNNWYSVDENGNATLTPQSNELYIGNVNDSNYSSNFAENVTNTLSIQKYDGTDQTKYSESKYYIYTDGKTNIPYVVSYKVTLGTEETRKFYGNLSSSETFTVNYETGKLTQKGTNNNSYTSFVIPGSINRGNSGGTTMTITSSTGYTLPNGQSAVGSNVSFDISEISGGAALFGAQNICKTSDIINRSTSCKVLDIDVSQNHDVSAQGRKDLYLKYNQPDSFKEWVLKVDDNSTTVNESQVSYGGIFGSSFTNEKKNEANARAVTDGYLVLGYGTLSGNSTVGSVSYNESTKGGFIVYKNNTSERLYSLVERNNASQTIKTWYANDKLADTWNGSEYVLGRRTTIAANNIFDMNSWVKSLVTNSSNISISSNGKNRNADFELITHANAIGKYTFKFNSNTYVEREFDVTNGKTYVLSVKTTSTTGTVNVSITSGTASGSGTLSGSNRTDIKFTANSSKAKIRISGSAGALAEVEWISVQEGTTFSYYTPYNTSYNSSQIDYKQNGTTGEVYRKYVSKREARSWTYVSYDGQYLYQQDDYLGQFHTDMSKSYQFVDVLGNPSNFNSSIVGEMLAHEADNFIAVSGKPNTVSGGTLPVKISAADTDEYRLIAVNYDGENLYETNYAKYELKVYLGLFFYKNGVLEDSTSAQYTKYLKSTEVEEFTNQVYTVSNPVRDNALITYSYADAVLYNSAGSKTSIADPNENIYTSLVNYTEDGVTYAYIADIITQPANEGRVYQYGNNSIRIFRETGNNVDRTQSTFYKTQIYVDHNDKDAGEGWVDVTETFNFGPSEYEFKDGAGDIYNYQRKWTLIIKGKLNRGIEGLYIIGEGKTYEGEDKSKAVGGDTVYLTVQSDGRLTIRNAILSEDDGANLSIYSFDAYVKINGTLVPATTSNINKVTEIYSSNAPGSQPLIVDCIPFFGKSDNTKNFTSNQSMPQTIAFYDEMQILIGRGAPTNDIGRNNLSYLDADNNKRYIKQNGVWTYIDTIDASEIIYNDFELAKSGYKAKDLIQHGSVVTYVDTFAQQETDRGFWVSSSEATFYSTNTKVYGASWETRNVFGNEIGSNSFYYETEDYGYLIIPGKKIIAYSLDVINRTSFAVTNEDREIPYLIKENGKDVVNPEYSKIAQNFGTFDYGMVGESEYYILNVNGQAYTEKGEVVQFLSREAAQNYINAWKTTRPSLANATIQAVVNNAKQIPYLYDENGTEYGSNKPQYTFNDKIYGDFYEFGSTYALTNESINLYYAVYLDDKGATQFEYYWGNSDARLNQIVSFLQKDFYYYNTNADSATYSYALYVCEVGDYRNYYFLDENGKLYNTQTHWVSIDISDGPTTCTDADTGETYNCSDLTGEGSPIDEAQEQSGYWVTDLTEIEYEWENGNLRITSGTTVGELAVPTGRRTYYNENGVLLNTVAYGSLSYSEVELVVRSATSEETIYENIIKLRLRQDDKSYKYVELPLNTYFENTGKTLYKWELQMANSNYAVMNVNNYFSDGENGGGFYTRKFDESTNTVYSEAVSQIDFSGSSAIRSDSIGLSGAVASTKVGIGQAFGEYFLGMLSGMFNPVEFFSPGATSQMRDMQIIYSYMLLGSYGAGDLFSSGVNAISLAGAISPTNAVALVPKTILSKVRSKDVFTDSFDEFAEQMATTEVFGHATKISTVVFSFMDLEYGGNYSNSADTLHSSLNKKSAGLYETHLLGNDYQSDSWSDKKYQGATFKEVIPEYVVFNNSTISVDYNSVKGTTSRNLEYGSYHGRFHNYSVAGSFDVTSFMSSEDAMNNLSTAQADGGVKQEFSYSMAFLYAYYDMNNPAEFTLYKERMIRLANKVVALYKGYKSWAGTADCAIGAFINGIETYAKYNSAAYTLADGDNWLLTSEGLVEVINSSFFSWEESASGELNYRSTKLLDQNLYVNVEYKGFTLAQLWQDWQNGGQYTNLLYSDMAYKVAKDQNGNLVVKIYKNARNERTSQLSLINDALKDSTDAHYCTTLYIVQKENMVYVYVEIQDTDYIQVSSGVFQTQSLVSSNGKNIRFKTYSSFFNDHKISDATQVKESDYEDPRWAYPEMGQDWTQVELEWVFIKHVVIEWWLFGWHKIEFDLWLPCIVNHSPQRYSWDWNGDHPGWVITAVPVPAGEFNPKEIAGWTVSHKLGTNGQTDIFACTVPLNMYIPITSSRYGKVNYEDERYPYYVMLDGAIANADKDTNDFLNISSETYKNSNHPSEYFNRSSLTFRDLDLMSVTLDWPNGWEQFKAWAMGKNLYETDTYSKVLYKTLGSKINGKTIWSLYTSTSGHVFFRDSNGNFSVPRYTNAYGQSRIQDYYAGTGGGLRSSQVVASIDDKNTKYDKDTDGKTHTMGIYGTDFKLKINISGIQYAPGAASKVTAYEQNYEYGIYITTYNGKKINELSDEEITTLASLGYNQIRTIRETGSSSEITVAYYSGTVKESYNGNGRPDKTVDLSYIFRDKINPKKDSNGNDLADGLYWYTSSYYLKSITIDHLLPSATYKVTIRMRYINCNTSQIKVFTVYTEEDMVYNPWNTYLRGRDDGYYSDGVWRGDENGLLTKEVKDQFYTYSIKYNDELFLKTGGIILFNNNYYTDKTTSQFYGKYYTYNTSTNQFSTSEYNMAKIGVTLNFAKYREVESEALKKNANKVYISDKKSTLIISSEKARPMLSYDYYSNDAEHRNNVPDEYRYRYYNNGQKPIIAYISLVKDGQNTPFTQTNLYLNFEKKLGDNTSKYSIKQSTNGTFAVNLENDDAERLGLKQLYEEYIEDYGKVITVDSLKDGFDPLNDIILNRANWNIYLTGGDGKYTGYKFTIHAYYRFSASYEALYFDFSRVLTNTQARRIENNLFETYDKGLNHLFVYEVTDVIPSGFIPFYGSINKLLGTGFDINVTDLGKTFYDYWGYDVNNGVKTNETTDAVIFQTQSEFDANNANGRQVGENQRKTVTFNRNGEAAYYLCEIDENGNTIGILV